MRYYCQFTLCLHFTYLQEKNANELLYYEKRADCHRERGFLYRAIADYEIVLSRNPGNKNCRVALAETFADAGDPDRAIKGKAVTKDITHVYIHFSHLYSTETPLHLSVSMQKYSP